MMAHWDDVKATFRAHFAHYAAHGGGENALVGLRAEGSVTLQYAGRVVYELFQNALDQTANTRTVVKFDGRVLIVGNDGTGISVDPHYDYSRPIEGEGRSDFHALCALHTSNKSPERQFGNKGIGFRSVFGVSDQVQVWSRCAAGGWWGLELKERLVPSTWPGSALPELDEIVRALGDQARPSFQFPRPLRNSADPVDGCIDITTVIRVEVDNDDHAQQIAHEVERLSTTRFQFVGLRRPGLSFLINDIRVSSSSGWRLVTGPRHHNGFPELADLARLAKHPIPAPAVAVAWPEGRSSEDTPVIGLFYNYLPTRMSTGLPIDIHGDFQVKADREGMALEADSGVGKYNLELLQRAAEGHVEALLAEAQQETPRPDLWQLANRPADSVPGWTAALRAQLFPDDKLDAWLNLAELYFRTSSEERSCREFWDASLRWVETLVGCGHWTKKWVGRAGELCDALAKRQIRVIPIVAEGGQRAVAVPSRQDKGQRAERRVFYWSPRGQAEIPPVPVALLRMGRVVTSFPLGAFENPAGIQSFSEAEILPELRQVPNDPSMQESGSTLTPDEQGSLLLFAYRLSAGRNVFHFAWRAFAESEDQERVGRALATMYLPTIDGMWAPARQLTEDQVDVKRMAALMRISEDLHPFLRTLGVAPARSVPLVEDGEAGLLPASSAPPTPQEAGNRPVAPIAPVLTKGVSLVAVAAAVKDLRPDNARSVVFERVRSEPWMSADIFRNFDGVPPLPEYLAPWDVVLHSHDPQRIFFAVPLNDADHEDLRSFGAMQSPDDESLAIRAPTVLIGLETRLPSPALLSASISLSLAALYNRLMRILSPDGTDQVPVLVERAGRYAWLVPGEEAWLARREERQELRRFFSDLPLVAAEYRDGLAERLHVKPVRLRKAVQPSDALPTETSCAEAIRRRIEPHLAVLAAVADQSRQAAKTLSEERIQRAWREQAPIVEVADAWVELRVEGPDREPIPWRKNEYEDVFHLPGRNDSDPGKVIFDIDNRPEASAKCAIPLRFFGDALAALLVNNVALGPLFAQVLASIEEGRLDDFVERNHLTDIVKEWTARLRPLTPGERQELLELLEKICLDPPNVLRRQNLRPLVRYLPNVVVAADNEMAWRKWYGHRKESLAALVVNLEGRPTAWRSDLATRIRKSYDQLDFAPSGIVAALVKEWGAQFSDLEASLDEISPRFQPVSAPPLTTAAAGWRAGRGRFGSGQGGPQRKLTAEDLLDDQVARSMIGDAAERALLAWVVPQVANLQERDGFADALLSAFRTNSKTWREVKLALDEGDFDDALYIANRWSGAGFDILGLDDHGGELQPVRYECKGISGGAEHVWLHLSRNELAVARKIRRDGPGRWVLVGVQPDGTCVDLTSLIDDLLEDEERPLEPLYQRGLEPDGLRLVVERNSGAVPRQCEPLDKGGDGEGKRDQRG